MPDLESAVLRSSSPVADRVEGVSTAPTYDVRIHRTQWLDHGEGVFRSRDCFIEMLYDSARLVTGAYDRPDRRPAYVPVGDIAFVARDEPLLCRWRRGVQRSVSCLFDIEAIAARTAVEWRWPDFDRHAALAMRSDPVRDKLWRIAQEMLEPGFASELQIETLLMGIAFDLHRQFAGTSAPMPVPAGRLSRWQLQRLRERAVDTSGAPPTIAELAALLGMGGRQLAARYRATTGQTLRGFVADSRLERARIQLGDPALLVKQVAFDCGFRSSAAFAAAFQRRTGQTPQAWRSARMRDRG